MNLETAAARWWWPAYSVLLGAFFPADLGAVPPETGFLEWASEAAVRVPFDDTEAAVESVSVFSDLLRRAKIVYLGEADHYVHEKYDYRLLWLRVLHQYGFRHLGMEMGLSDGARVDRYLETGDPWVLDRVALYDPDQRGLDGLPGNSDAEFQRRFRCEETRFFDQLRQLGGAERFHWFGFDVDTRPGGGYEDARVLLSTAGHDPSVTRLLSALEPPESLKIEDELAHVRKTLSRASENGLARALGRSRFGRLVGILAGLRDSLAFRVATRDGPMSPNWLPAMREREEVMKRQVDERLADLPPDAKIVLMGHDTHLSKRADLITFGRRSSSGPGMWPSVGSHVERKYPGQVVSIWMLHENGRHANLLLASPIRKIPGRPGRIENLLGQIGPVLALPTRSSDTQASLLSDCEFGVNHGFGHGDLQSQADLLFFVRQVSEPRCLADGAEE